MLVNTAIYILFPIMVYMFYMAYKKTFDEKEDELWIIFLIFSIAYIILNFDYSDNFKLILLNIPLILSYYKKNDISIIISSLIIIICSLSLYSNLVFVFVLEYILIYFMNKKLSLNNLVFLIILLNTVIIYVITRDLTNIIYCLYLLVLSLLIIYLMKRANEILKMHKSLKETLQTNDLKNSLFKITHEIKNPIAVCKGYLDMFDVNNKKHSTKYIPILKEEINKTLILLDDFLSMNKLKLNKDILDVNMLLNEVIDNYSLYLKNNKIKLINNISDDEIYVNGDYNRLNQVFLNIIKNAIESLEDKRKIEITSKQVKNQVYIYIKDSGSGMDSETLEKIKTPFFTTKKNGNGLGVALSREIIEAHNGNIIYESKKGKYTLVTVVLPIEKIY